MPPGKVFGCSELQQMSPNIFYFRKVLKIHEEKNSERVSNNAKLKKKIGAKRPDGLVLMLNYGKQAKLTRSMFVYC